MRCTAALITANAKKEEEEKKKKQKKKRTRNLCNAVVAL